MGIDEATNRAPSRVRRFSIQLSWHSKWIIPPTVALRNHPERITFAPAKRGNGMVLDLLGDRRDRLLFICQATVLALILITTVSCSGPAANMPPPIAGIVDLFSGGVTETPKQDAPKAISRPVSRPASKKANAPAQADDQSDQQLYQQFLEWQKRQKGQP